MHILIDSDKQNNASICFDVYGNLYIDEKYQINISGNNKPYLEFGKYGVVNNLCTKKIKVSVLQNQNNLLKNKIKETTKHDFDDDSGDENDNDIDYYPENVDDDIDNSNSSDNDYIDEDNIKQYGEDNLQFNFWNNLSDVSLITERENGDIMALYDTYIYDNDNLVFKSVSQNNSSIYVIKINTNGNIYFRPIGYNETVFRTKMVENDTLELVINL